MARRYYREPTFTEIASHEAGYALGARLGCLRLLAIPVALILWVLAFFGLNQAKAERVVVGLFFAVLGFFVSRWILRRPR